jgi:hypothetical protein
MEAHSCHHCNKIVIDLPSLGVEFPRPICSTLPFEKDAVKSAVRNGCKFFQWVLEVDLELLDADVHGEYVDHRMEELTGMCSNHVSSNEEWTASAGMQDVSQLDSNTVPQFQLELDCYEIYPGRVHLTRKMIRNKKRPFQTHNLGECMNTALEFVTTAGVSLHVPF